MEQLIAVELEKWTDIFRINDFFLGPFVFRGQSDVNWNLETSIERAAKRLGRFKDLSWIPIYEKWMIHDFKRKYPLLSNVIPSEADSFEWLAIMQHHGAPTRLLDFSQSFFIALYFATIEADQDVAVWAINRLAVKDELLKQKLVNYNTSTALKDSINLNHIELANKVITLWKETDYENAVIPLEPKICTERLSKQQGLFLMPTNAKISFIDNFKRMFSLENVAFTNVDFSQITKYSSEIEILKNREVKIIKFIIPRDIIPSTLQGLNKMNISAETLFPGIDGLAKSLLHTNIRI